MAKNQKSITHFFSQKQQTSIGCGLSRPETPEKKSAKRKELSPVQSQNIDKTAEQCFTNSTHIDTNGLNTQKKIKLNHSSKKISPLKITVHNADKTTPEKENGHGTSLSPRKYSTNNKNLSEDGKKTNERDDISQNKNNRSPLTHINVNDVLASSFDENDEFTQINSLGNLVHDHVQNGIIECKRSAAAQKSPEKGKIVCSCCY